jgi:hypothetical protein
MLFHKDLEKLCPNGDKVRNLDVTQIVMSAKTAAVLTHVFLYFSAVRAGESWGNLNKLGHDTFFQNNYSPVFTSFDGV